MLTTLAVSCIFPFGTDIIIALGCLFALFKQKVAHFYIIYKVNRSKSQKSAQCMNLYIISLSRKSVKQLSKKKSFELNIDMPNS